MATGQGTVTVNFGAFPGTQEASVAFADITISAGSKIEAYVMSDGTSGTHTANDHRYLGLLADFTAQPNAGIGGTVFARALQTLIGTYQLRYVWAD